MEKETFDNVNAQIAMLKLAKCMILTGHDKTTSQKLTYFRQLRARINNGEEKAINEALNMHPIKLRR